VLGGVTDEDLCAEALQALGHRRGLEVGTGDLVTEVEQHLGNAAHAGTTDADEVDAADTAHAADFRTGGSGRLNHGPPPGRCPPRCGWRPAWPGCVRYGPWP